MKRSWKELLLRIVILLFGLTIAHLGVSLFLLTDMGSDPFNVLIQGLFRTSERLIQSPLITHGRVHIVINFLIIVVLLFVDKSYIKIGTLLCMICGGPIIDVFNSIFTPLFDPRPSLPISILILCAACVILAFGMTLVIQSDAGTGPNDLVALVTSQKLGKKFSIVRIIVDFSFVLAGFLLGGSFGAGTIVCAVLVGPVAGFFLPYSEKIVKKVLIVSGGISYGDNNHTEADDR